MSSARIKEAAELLRVRAEAATPGPWVTDHAEDVVSTTANSNPWVAHPYKHGRTAHDATFIATMHPGVALALADWLDVMAAFVQSGNDVPGMRGRGLTEALALADAILGTTTHEGARDE
jgi:hypothetical protein